MRQLCPTRYATLALVATALTIGGCGGGVRGVSISGQVLQNGKAIKFLPSEEIIVGLSAQAPAGENPIAAWGTVKPDDGSFTVAAPDGRGIPAGKYIVVVSSQLYQQSKDRFEAVFDNKKPPLIVDVGPDSGQHFIIDVGTRTVTKR
jgi:hypothetical protein